MTYILLFFECHRLFGVNFQPTNFFVFGYKVLNYLYYFNFYKNNKKCCHFIHQLKLFYKEEEEGRIDSLIKNQKQLNIELNKKNDTSATKILKRISFTMMLVIMLLSILGYYFKINRIASMKECVNIIDLSSRKMAVLQYISLYIRNLVYLNEGLFPSISSDYESQLRQNIDNSLNELDNLNQAIEFSTLNSLAYSDNVPMYFQETDVYTSFDLNEASEQIITKAYYINNLPLTEMYLNRSEVYFVIYNSMNDYFMTLNDLFNNMIQNVLDVNDAISNIAMIFLVVSISLIFSLSLMNTVFFQKAYKIKEQILTVFLDIPQKTAKLLYSKCENFLVNISSGFVFD